MGRRWTGLLAAIALLGALAPAAFASPSPKIVGGGTTTIGTYPWQVALDYNIAMQDDFENQFCGGSLLTTRIVQTAAHCIHDGDPDCSDPTCNGGADDPTGDGTEALDPDDLYVVKGATTLSTATAANEVNVQAIYEDAGYDDSTTQNDFAWVVLDTAVPLNANVKTIQVAAPSEASVWDTNSPTEVSGWGDTCDGCNAPPDDLKSAVVPRVADGDCADPLSYGTEFFPAVMLCAGYLAGGTDACFGDSGGPLVGPATVASKTRLVGVVSFGDGCAKVNKPTVYSRIADYPGGIQSVIDFIEAPAQENLPDGGSVVGDGTAVGVANGPGQSLIRPPPAATPAAAATSTPTPKCKKKKKKKHKKKKCKR